MSYELSRRPDYTPVGRNSSTTRSPVSRMMALRADALIDRAAIAAEIANEEFQIRERINAGFRLTKHIAILSAELRDHIRETGNDPDMHQLHSFMMGASAEATVNFVRGDDRR